MSEERFQKEADPLLNVQQLRQNAENPGSTLGDQTRVGTVAENPTVLDRSISLLAANERWIVLATIVLQVGVLVGMIALKTWTVATGQTIYVRVMPVDPRDLMRGDYVILSYEFSRADMIDGRAAGWDEPGNRTVYAVLRPEGDGKHWRISRFTQHRPDGEVFLRGSLGRGGRVEYGIESYFVQEGKGREYEDAIRSRRLSAELKVDSAGAAVVQRLHVDMK